MGCVACGYRGAPPAGVSQGLRAAAHLVFQADVRRRQFSESMRRTLVSASRAHARFLVVFAVASLPMTGFCALMLLGIWVGHDSDGDAFLGGITVAAWLVTLGAGVLGVLLVRRRQRRLEEQCSAHPPAAPGEPATCHVCGAPPSSGAGGVARCAFCGADNLVAPRVLERVRARQAITLQSFEQAVSAEIATFERATSGASAAIVAGAVATPIATFSLAIIALLVAESRRLPVDGAVRYAAVDTPFGQCIGKLRAREGGGVEVGFSAWRPSGLPEEQTLASGAPSEPLAAEAFIGRTVTTRDGDVGTIEEVFASPLTGNAALVRRTDGTTVSCSIAGLCLGARVISP